MQLGITIPLQKHLEISVDSEYDEACNRHVQRFIDTLIYGDYEDLKIKSIETLVPYSTLKKYVTVIT